ncbi:MAG TPA: exodeoxyribonuclease III [Clostridiales bacterium]|nr:MAG: exodeoxyribonuclease III [Clostridiales bacterium GWD2_32_19]HCC06610.1 exodeoxyribonuclease III [Clostridiales bacterium]
MKIISWNLNGIRSANKKGFLDWLTEVSADLICFQETRATEEQINEIIPNIEGYNLYFNSAKRLGYSGTGLIYNNKYINISSQIYINKFDEEGRTIITEYPEFVLINSYVPNGTSRLEFKLEYIDELLKICEQLIAGGKEIILCTDFNIAHDEIDLSHPKENKRRSGFLDVERKMFDKLLNIGFIDTYRYLNPDKREYSWISYKARTLGGDFGWRFRFDYIFVTKNLIQNVKKAMIHNDVFYSDHCPIELEIDM